MSINLIGISGKAGSGKDLVSSIIKWLTSPKTRVGFREDFNLYMKSGGTFSDNWTTKKFADKLKDIVCMLIGCTREQLEDREFKEKELGEEWWYYQVNSIKGKSNIFPFIGASKHIISECILYKHTPRTLLQLLGTDCGRDIIHPNIWVNSLFSDYKYEVVEKTGKAFTNGSNKYYIPSLDEYPEELWNKIVESKNFTWYERAYPNWIISDVRFSNEVKAIEDRQGILIRLNRNTEYDNYISFIKSGNHSYEDLNSNQDPMSFDLFNRQKDSFKARFKGSDHESETALDNYKGFDYVIDNNGSIEDLIIKVKDILIKEGVI